jgi:hypothetical protein
MPDEFGVPGMTASSALCLVLSVTLFSYKLLQTAVVRVSSVATNGVNNRCKISREVRKVQRTHPARVP